MIFSILVVGVFGFGGMWAGSTIATQGARDTNMGQGISKTTKLLVGSIVGLGVGGGTRGSEF